MATDASHDARIELTLGSLDAVLLQDRELHLHGWACAADGRPIDKLRLALPSTAEASFTLGLDSGYVAKAHPQLRTAQHARFHLRTAPPETLRGKLFGVLPYVEGRRGHLLLRLEQPSIPPPPSDSVTGVGGELLVGQEYLAYFVQLAGLQPHEAVLDVGCGVGRMAYFLAHYLDDRGRYEGFDIVDKWVGWAADVIGKARPNFLFEKVNVYNRMYNPSGTLRADTLRFPYDDHSFDFVFLTSVFTHIPTAEVRQYIREIARVLRPGGRVLATAFLLTADSRTLIKQGKSSHPIQHPHAEACYIGYPTDPEHAVGFDEAPFLEWFGNAGLALQSSYPGTWCGRSPGLTYQDILVLRK